MQIRELQESERTLRCAYCHAHLEATARSFTCQGCGTRLHEECVAGLSRCPTLGCIARLPRPLVFWSFPWVRTFLGALLLAASGFVLFREWPDCDDPACERGRVAGLAKVLLFGLSGAVLLATAVRDWRRRWFGVAWTILGAFGLVSVLPGVMIALGAPSSVKLSRVESFSYSILWNSLGEGFIVSTFPSAHAAFWGLVLVHLAWRLSRSRPLDPQAVGGEPREKGA